MFESIFKVHSKKDARDAYKAIKMLLDLYNKGIDKDLVEEIMVATKRNIRKWSHVDCNTRYIDNECIKSRIVKDNGIDGCVELIELPCWVRTLEEAENFFRSNLYIEYVPTYYDCTGQHFTTWYKVFRRNGKYMAYHVICVDI